MSVEKVVTSILNNIKKRGDAALFQYTWKYDRHRLNRGTIQVTRRERRAAWRKISPELKRDLREAATRIRRFHRRQTPKSWTLREEGIKTGWRWLPLERVGIYVPGGRASYPSTVLMNAIPARVAGVSEIIMTTPAREGRIDPSLLIAADIAGVDRIFKIGGAQAIAALALGTRSIPPVDKIVGPGNKFVAEAKRQVFGRVGIDMLAGPTEIVIIADSRANPAWIAIDLIAQAEHDPEAVPIVISPSRSLLAKVRREVEKGIARIGRRKIARAAFMKNGDAIHVKNLDRACALANRLAPEHLEIHVKNPGRLLSKIRNAGAIFLGPYAPAAVGDYAAGTNHVLPTNGSARFSSPLSVYDFMKGSNVIELSRKGLKKMASLVRPLARIEGLTAHAESVEARLR